MIKSILADLNSRKERRQEARDNKTVFIPQYNGQEPMRVQHKAVLKIQINESRRKAKKK